MSVSYLPVYNVIFLLPPFFSDKTTQGMPRPKSYKITTKKPVRANKEIVAKAFDAVYKNRNKGLVLLDGTRAEPLVPIENIAIKFNERMRPIKNITSLTRDICPLNPCINTGYQAIFNRFDRIVATYDLYDPEDTDFKKMQIYITHQVSNKYKTIDDDVSVLLKHANFNLTSLEKRSIFHSLNNVKRSNLCVHDNAPQIYIQSLTQLPARARFLALGLFWFGLRISELDILNGNNVQKISSKVEGCPDYFSMQWRDSNLMSVAQKNAGKVKPKKTFVNCICKNEDDHKYFPFCFCRTHDFIKNKGDNPWSVHFIQILKDFVLKSHSFRVSITCLAYTQGIPQETIKTHLRWEKASMVQYYSRNIDFIDEFLVPAPWCTLHCNRTIISIDDDTA